MNPAPANMTGATPDMQPLLLGVWMSVYAGDKAAEFERALLSMIGQQLAHQTRLHIYLGVDGPVSDAVEAVIERHAAALHRVLRSGQNRGLAATLNALIEAREDESFYFRMDADDYSLPLRLQSQIDHMQAHPETDILGTDIIEVDVATGERRIVAFLDRPENLRRFICLRPPVAHPTVCFRRRVFEQVPAYPLLAGNEDIAMWFACAAHGMRFDNVHVPLLEFTVSANFWQRRGVKKSWGEFKSYWHGIVAMRGPYWRLVFPVLRLLLRLSPTGLSRLAYRARSQA